MISEVPLFVLSYELKSQIYVNICLRNVNEGATRTSLVNYDNCSSHFAVAPFGSQTVIKHVELGH